MKVVRCVTPGDVADLEVVDVPDQPVPTDGARVDVVACGVNYVDALFVEGRYQIKPTPPFVPGSEVAGVIGEVGPAWDGPETGSRVLVSCGMGGFASSVVVRPGQAVGIPDALTFDAAACFTQSYSTALFALRDRASLRAGEQVLVLGASGGVGQATIAVAKALGATVVAAASTEAKRAAALAAGADHVVNGEPSTLKDAVRALVPRGVDVVLDPVGGASSEVGLRLLGDGGRLCIVGFVAGPIPSLPTNQILLRNRTVVGVDWGIWALHHQREQAALLEELLDHVARGTIAPAAPSTFALDDAVAALQALQARSVVGKVALRVS